MAKKQTIYNTKGMNRDMSVFSFNSEFCYENRNLRLSTNEGNTMMSWVNERGPAEIAVKILLNPWDDSANYKYDDKINGIPIGTAVVNHQLVLFTTETSGALLKSDYIYCLHYSNKEQTKMEGKILYNGNLNFNVNYPLETLVYIESSNIEKVYWTDGLNQPRLINIKANNAKLKKWNSTTNGNIDTFFDFVPSINSNETFEVTKNLSGGGLFAPGVIQYCFTYLNKYGQQSNIVAVSPLYYLAHDNRGASAEDKVSNSFNIKISSVDKNFDYVRLYSLQRTSNNDNVVAKLLDDIPIEGTTETALFSRRLIAANDNSYVVPIVDGIRVQTAVVQNGSYSVEIQALQGTEGYSNLSHFNIVAYTNTNAERPNLMSFQTFISQVYNNIIPNEDDYHISDYHVRISISRTLDEYLGNAAQNRGYSNWGLKVGDKVITGSASQGFYGLNFIYSYQTQMWYITEQDAVEKVIKNEIKGNDYVTYTDNGTTGSTVDPMELLYVGGKDISAYTMAYKDNTLFLGNIVQRNTLVTKIQDYFDKNRKAGLSVITFDNKYGVNKTLQLDHTNGIYSHTNELNKNQSQITTFKGGETYRFGFQLQKYTGEWLEPIWIEDAPNTLYPYTTLDLKNIDTVGLVYAKGTIAISSFKDLIPNFDKIFRRIRPVVVFPTIDDRSVLCQGVLNPTLFNVEDRVTNSPFAQASWYFRPYMWNTKNTETSSSDTEVRGYISVVKSEKSTSDTISKGTEDKDVYVLVATLPSNMVDTILSRGYLQLHYVDVVRHDNQIDDEIDTLIQCDFFGAIPISYNIYAFLSNNRWQAEIIDETYEPGPNTEGRRSYTYSDGISNVVTDSNSYPLYNNLFYTALHIPYYSKQGDGSATYIFKFNAGTSHYEVTFKSVGDNVGYTINTHTGRHLGGSGNSVRFTHYDSLYTTSEFKSQLDNKTASFSSIQQDAMNVEIEGSVKVHSTPFEGSGYNSNCNSQFFVDQSIVTLNSPDIEFDSEVQRFSTDNLKLRIVGAIPITANISAHSILRSSDMLENNHNNNPTKAYFGWGESSNNVKHNNIDLNAGNRLVADYLWNDVHVVDNGNKEDKVTTSGYADYLVYPWQRTGSLNDDTRASDTASSLLQTKKESNLLFSIQTKYMPNAVDFNKIDTQITLTENAEVMNYRLPRQKATSSEINYYPNIDKVLVNGDTYKILGRGDNDTIASLKETSSPISMKYKSTSHAVIALDADSDSETTDNNQIPILPYAKLGEATTGKYTFNGGSTNTFWGDTHMSFKQSLVDVSDIFSGLSYNFLWIGELYKDVTNRFGGTTSTALRNNKWLIGGEAVNLKKSDGTAKDSVDLIWTNGDTYYQRYDCLKTYAFTNQDPNQIIEILSFMCETHVNIDGRYDRNRGQINNLNMNPTIFNLLNPVYSQQDNFFTYRKMDTEDTDNLDYSNQIYYSKTKESGADVDLYTNITLGSVLELDGDKGSVNAIKRFNDNLIAFQDKGIAQILYNENVQIATQAGVPIEIANSGKVQGKRYFSDNVGCSNKWAMATTPNGIYFMDNINKNIYLFNGQLQNISLNNGFNSWCKQNMINPNTIWNPYSFGNFVAYYDKLNQDILFINKNIALAYSERFGIFTSFYDYGDSPYYISLDNTGIWAKFYSEMGTLKEYFSDKVVDKPSSGEFITPVVDDSDKGIITPLRVNAADPTRAKTDTVNFHITKLYSHNKGEYNNFFGERLPYWTILACNPEPQIDKTFTNVEFQSIMNDDGNYDDDDETKFNFNLPFDYLETWNDYQHGEALLNHRGYKLFQHHTNNNYASLKRKFRLWRCDIPRDNVSLSGDERLTDEGFSLTRYKVKPLNRMRNPWLYLKLKKDNVDNYRTQFHDIILTYFT